MLEQGSFKKVSPIVLGKKGQQILLLRRLS